MNIYPYILADVSPNAMRSSHNPDRVFLSREPRRGNMSPYPEILDDWCGATNDIDCNALGAVDTDEPDWWNDLIAALPDDTKPDRAEIEAWINNPNYRDEEGDNDLQIPTDTPRSSSGFTWDESGDDSFYPETRDGWQCVASYDQNDDIEHFDSRQHRALEVLLGAWCGCDVVTKLLDATTISYDYQDHETHDNGTDGTDWAVVGVCDGDVANVHRVLDLAAALAAVEDMTKETLLTLIKAAAAWINDAPSRRV